MIDDGQTRRQFLKNTGLSAGTIALLSSNSTVIPDDLWFWQDDLSIVDGAGDVIDEDVTRIQLAGGLSGTKMNGSVRLTAPSEQKIVSSDSTDTESTNTPSVEVGISSDQAVPSGGTHQVEFHTSYDGGDLAWFDSSNHRIVVPEDGLYLVIYNQDWRNSPAWSDGDRHSSKLIHNGDPSTGCSMKWYGPSGMDTDGADPQPGSLSRSRMCPLSANDTIGINVEQQSGSTQYIDNRRRRTHLSVTGPL